MVFRLPVPRLVHDARRDGALPGIGQHLHNRAHRVEVRLTPERHLIVAGYGIRILPQIQIELPFLRSGQRPIQYLYLELQLFRFEILSRNGQCPLIFAGACVRGNPHLQPNRLGGTCLHIAELHDVERVGHDGRIPFRFVLPVSTTAFAVFVQFVGHDIADEVRRYRRSRNHR